MDQFEKKTHELLATVYRDLSNVANLMRCWKPNEEKHILELQGQIAAYYNLLFAPLHLETTFQYLIHTKEEK